jgi:hypothetical protein
MKDTCAETIKHRCKNPPPPDEYLLVDTLLEAEMSEEQLLCDAITYLVGGFHTTGNCRSWYTVGFIPISPTKCYPFCLFTISSTPNLHIHPFCLHVLPNLPITHFAYYRTHFAYSPFHLPTVYGWTVSHSVLISTHCQMLENVLVRTMSNLSKTFTLALISR